MDDEGLDPDALEAELRRVRRAALVPVHDPDLPEPDGPDALDRAAPADRRAPGRARPPGARGRPYGLVRFEGVAPPSLHELEGGELVTYTSSFSKTVAPGCAPGTSCCRSTTPGVRGAAVSTYISPPFLAQATIAELIAAGASSPTSSTCARSSGRRDAMLQALAASFPGTASWSRPAGGYFVWLELGDGVDSSALAERAEAAGVLLVRGDDFFPPARASGGSSARLAFSFEPPERIAAGIELLAALL